MQGQAQQLQQPPVPGRPSENVAVVSDVKSSLVYRDGLLISGDLDMLIQHLLPSDSYEPCSNYLFTFLLCGRLFIPTTMLLRRLLDNIEALRADRNKALGLLLTHWVQKCPYDFLNPLLLQVLERECMISITGPLRESVMRELRTRLDRVRLYQNYLSLLRQITVSNEKLMDGCAPVTDDGDEVRGGSSSSSSGAGDRTSGGSAILSAVSVSDQNGGGDSGSCESPFVNMEEAVPERSLEQVYEEFHLNCFYANNANRKNLQRIGELKVAVRTYQASLCDMSTTAAQVAHQLTHIEVERLAFIGPEEFVQAFVKQQRERGEKEEGEDELQQHKLKGSHIRTPAKEARHRDSANEEWSARKLTQNLENYVQWFNRLTYLVASDIVKVSECRVMAMWIGACD